MSGIVGLVRTDWTPVDRALVQHLTASLDLHGPDARATWCSGPVGLGHTLLRTGPDPQDQSQPFSVDGRTWIVADARIDDRRSLLHRLGDDDRERPSSQASDAALILWAYRRWGEGCVEHLIGDFAFAIWDDEHRRLFCARDHMGVKPLYYAHAARWLVVSNALESVRRHPVVSDTLNDLAVADFLLFGLNQDRATTSFRDIQRLPPAHTLTWSESGLTVRRYWTQPIEEPVHFRDTREYVDRFDELLRDAVSDRLRTSRVSIFMSGGLDSPALAAAAQKVLGRDARPSPVRAFTFVYDALIPDTERRYAALAAEHLGVPISFCVLDDDHEWTPSTSMCTPEPLGVRTDSGAARRCLAAMSTHSRVAFFGEGPDNALWYEWRPYLTHLLRTRRWGRLAADLGRHLVSHKRLPLIPSLPRIVKARLARKRFEPVFPRWMAHDLVRRLRLEDRWRDLNAVGDFQHPVRPEAYASLADPRWQAIFETFAPPYTGVALEVRHPFLDLRLLRFLLRVPTLPWCRDKYLVRCALRGVVPEEVRLRPKTPLTGDPDYEEIRRHGPAPALPGAEIAAYGDVNGLSTVAPRTAPAAESDLRLVALSYWLRDFKSLHIDSQEETRHELSGEVAEPGRGQEALHEPTTPGVREPPPDGHERHGIDWDGRVVRHVAQHDVTDEITLA